MRKLLLFGIALCAYGQLRSGPELHYDSVPGWAKLPAGWNFGEVTGVSVDKSDNVWVFNRGLHPVIEFDRDGKMLQAWEAPPVISAHGIKVDPEGNVWLVDVSGHSVMKFTPQGKLLMVLANAGRTAGDNKSKEAFNRPTAVAFLPSGEFFVSDGYINTRVVNFSRNGEYLNQWGSPGTGDGQFNLVHDVVVGPNNTVYVADRNNNRIQLFDTGGKFIDKWLNLGSPWGLAYSAKDNALFMSDGVNDRVLKLKMDGEILGVLGSHGKTLGKFDFPHHIAVDSTGALYVAEIKNWRIQKFVPH